MCSGRMGTRRSVYPVPRRGPALPADALAPSGVRVDACATVAELTAAGVVVLTSTRVAEGPVTAIYGDGGGVDLRAAGAVPSGLLRPSQARVLLAALLGSHRDADLVRDAFARSAAG